MKKLLVALALFLAPALAWGQCTGVFNNNTVCGNASGTPNVPSSVDIGTFGGITALTGDVTATGPGSVPAALAIVNSNTGSWGTASAVPFFTVNGKGLITAAGSNAVIAPAGTLSGTALNSTVVNSSLTSVGTLTGGGTGTGFTLNFTNSTITGNLGVSHLNSGTGASSTTFWRGDGTWATPAFSTVPPSVQRFTSGSGTYTTPSGLSYIVVEMVGGGGSGGIGATNAAGNAGSDTSFAGWTAIHGGAGSPSAGVGGTGGTGGTNGTGILVNRFNGANGGGGENNVNSTLGGRGGSSFFGGAGSAKNNSVGSVGLDAAPNTGSGGGGSACSNCNGGGGGGAGEYVKFIITSPAASYSYAVGAGGAAAGSGSTLTGAGAAGIITVTEYRQ